MACRWVPDRTSWVIRPMKFSLNASCRSGPCQSLSSRAAAPSGSAATHTPLMAPTEVPTTTSGWMPASASARSIPTSKAPSTPPPPSTNAVFTRLTSSGPA
jgi:hypothetical protein